MQTKLLFSFLFISLCVGAQTTHQLGWGNTGSDANQQLTISVGDTVEWTWGAGTHNLVSTSGVETFDSGYHGGPGYVFSYTFNQVGATSYVCSPHAGNMYGTITVNAANGCANPEITQWTMSGNSVYFDGNNNPSIASYEVEYNLGSTFTPGDGIASTFSFTEFPATLTGLENSSLYYFTIRSICSDGTINDWYDNGNDGPDPWQTNSCTTNSLPYFNDFNDTESWASCNTFYDTDGDGNFWFYGDYNDDGDGVANNYCAISASYDNTAGILTPDNWIVIGPIDLTNVSDATMTWKARGQDASWCGENYTVYVGTENTIENLTSSSINFNETTSNDACGAWANRTLDISAASGSLVYIGFRHHAVSDMYHLNIDDLGVTGTSLGLEDIGESQFSFFPNPVNDVLTINALSSIDSITVYNMLGQTVITSTPNTNDSTVDMSALQTGAYFVQVSINNTINTVRVIKN